MEYLALYDEKGNQLKEKIERKKKLQLTDGKHFRIILLFIQNEKGEFLIQKVSQQKGNVYATTGGHVQYGATSLETVRQEMKEELGIDIKEGYQLYEIEKCPKAFVDCYYLKKELSVENLNLQKEEVESVEWMSIDKINHLILSGQFREKNISPYHDLLELISKKQLNLLQPLYKEVG